MIININDKYFAERDFYYYTLKEHTNNFDKKGNEITKTLGHYSDLKFLIKRVAFVFAEEELEDVTTLEKYIRMLQSQNSKIENLLKEVE